MGPRTGLDTVAKRKNPFPTADGNQSPVTILTELLQPISVSIRS